MIVVLGFLKNMLSGSILIQPNNITRGTQQILLSEVVGRQSGSQRDAHSERQLVILGIMSGLCKINSFSPLDARWDPVSALLVVLCDHQIQIYIYCISY